MKTQANRLKKWQKGKVNKIMSDKIQLCKRWVVVYDHDGSLVDGCIFMHRKKAELFVFEQKHPEKFRVEQAALMPVSMAEAFLFGSYGQKA
jgi:hypothetical protein